MKTCYVRLTDVTNIFKQGCRKKLLCPYSRKYFTRVQRDHILKDEFTEAFKDEKNGAFSKRDDMQLNLFAGANVKDLFNK